jgi:hypothetical protein
MIDQWNEYDMEMQFIVEMRRIIDEATQEFLPFSPRKLFDS